MTRQDKFAAALIARGEREVIPSPSGKYRCFTRAAGGFYWLGSSGAVRIGRTSTKSASVTDGADRLLRCPKWVRHETPTGPISNYCRLAVGHDGPCDDRTQEEKDGGVK